MADNKTNKVVSKIATRESYGNAMTRVLGELRRCGDQLFDDVEAYLASLYGNEVGEENKWK